MARDLDVVFLVPTTDCDFCHLMTKPGNCALIMPTVPIPAVLPASDAPTSSGCQLFLPPDGCRWSWSARDIPQHRLGSRVSVKLYAVDLDTAQPLTSLSTIAPPVCPKDVACLTTHFNLFARNPRQL